MTILPDSDFELLHRSGYLWLPLLLDPSVASEIERTEPNPLVIEADGRRFVRTVSLRSLVESSEVLSSGSREELRRSSLKGIPEELMAAEPVVSERLKTILFSVMPHFVRRGKSLDRKRLGEDQLLDLIGERTGIRRGSAAAVTDRRNPALLRRVLADLERRSPAVELPEGRMSARVFTEWLSTALEARLLEEERRRLTRSLKALEEPAGASSAREAILLDVARTGALEIDGFGFLRTGPGDDYLVYKRTGEYALADYYGRLYLFPDCRVAVSTASALRPFVVETYKHPFLEAYDSGQEICLRRATPRGTFSAAAVVEALQEGLNALLHGYSSRRRNGYHSLEGIPGRAADGGPGGSEAESPVDDPVVRRRHMLDVDFSDYRVPRDHPGVASGQVPITNELFP